MDAYLGAFGFVRLFPFSAEYSLSLSVHKSDPGTTVPPVCLQGASCVGCSWYMVFTDRVKK